MASSQAARVEVVVTLVFLGAAGCGFHRITSEPSGARVYMLNAGQDAKPSPDDLNDSKETTPFTIGGGPFAHWYQVRMDGYVDSEVVFLPAQTGAGEQNHHFILQPKAPSAAATAVVNPPFTPPQPGAILVVFDIEDVTGLLKPQEGGQLQDFLATRLTELGGFKVVPGQQVRERLREGQQESYRQCYDDACQIELGKEVAANKTVSTRILKVGSTCVVTSKLYDLKSATSERAATARVGCNSDDLLNGMDQIAKQLAGGPASATGTVTQPTKPAPAPSPPPEKKVPRK